MTFSFTYKISTNYVHLNEAIRTLSTNTILSFSLKNHFLLEKSHNFLNTLATKLSVLVVFVFSKFFLEPHPLHPCVLAQNFEAHNLVSRLITSYRVKAHYLFAISDPQDLVQVQIFFPSCLSQSIRHTLFQLTQCVIQKNVFGVTTLVHQVLAETRGGVKGNLRFLRVAVAGHKRTGCTIGIPDQEGKRSAVFPPSFQSQTRQLRAIHSYGDSTDHRSEPRLKSWSTNQSFGPFTSIKDQSFPTYLPR